MSFQYLPVEVLMKIFNLVPDPGQYTVLCKSFYHAICSLPGDERQVKINEYDLLLTSTFLNNIAHSFEEVKVDSNNPDELLKKLGKYVKNVKISNRYVRNPTPIDINNILQHTPNCVELEFYDSRDMVLMEELKVNLPHLKRLIIPVRNFKHVTSIEKVLRENDLDSLICDIDSSSEQLISPVIKLLSSTTKEIKEVKLIATHRILEYDSGLEKIHSLNLNIGYHDGEFNGKELDKFKNLKKLRLSFERKFVLFTILKSSKIANLEYLELHCSFEKILNFFGDLRTPVLNMKVLIIDCICIEHPKQLEKILKVFKQLHKFKFLSVVCNEENKKLNFVQLDWKNCFNPSMKILELEIPQEYYPKLIGILKATYPNLTSLKVNDIQYIEQREESSDAQHFEKFLNFDYKLFNLDDEYLKFGYNFRDHLISNLENDSKIDILRTTNRKFGKLSIKIRESDLATEKFNHLLEFMHRQQKNIKELNISSNITYEVFWQLIALATNCRKIKIDQLNVRYIKDHMDDEPVAKFMFPDKVEEISYELNNDEIMYDAKILEKLMSVLPNLKKLTFHHDSYENIDEEYFENFLLNCNLECLEWCMHQLYFHDHEYDELSWTYEKNVITSIISRQKNLKTLRAKFQLWDEVFTEIVNNFKDLEEFEFYGAEELSPETFYGIQNLKKLKSLSFGNNKLVEFYGETYFTKLSSFLIGIRSLSLTSLSIFRIQDTSLEVFIELSALIPSLKSLTIEIIESSLHPCSILQHFGYLEELSIDMHGSISPIERVYNLEENPNLKSFSASTDKISLTLFDIRNILKACPNLQYLFIYAFKSSLVEYYGDVEEVSLDDLSTILEAGKKLKSFYISELEISDPENIEDCRLKRRFRAFEYFEKENERQHRQCEMILSSDKAGVQKMMKKNPKSEVLEKAYKQLALGNFVN